MSKTRMPLKEATAVAADDRPLEDPPLAPPPQAEPEEAGADDDISLTDEDRNAIQAMAGQAPDAVMPDKAFGLRLHLCWLMAGLQVAGDGWQDAMNAAADVLQRFFTANPDAPAAAGPVEIRLRLGEDLQPGADPRRVVLAMGLFRQVMTGLAGIAAADAAAVAAMQAAEAAAAQPPGRPLPESQKTWRSRKGLAAAGDFGAAMAGAAAPDAGGKA